MASKRSDEGVVSATVFTAGNAQLAVPFTGLLASQPDLRDQELPPSVWQRKLDAYIKSPRP